jgi:hypothetical protein
MQSVGCRPQYFEEDAESIRRHIPTMTGISDISEGSTWSYRRAVEKSVGVCAIVSGSAHGLVTQGHFQEWWGYGVFFLVTAICLIGFGLALFTDAIDPRYMPGDVDRLRRLMYTVGAVGIVGILGLYLITRTAGIPFGPESGSVESAGLIDLVAKGAELLATAGLVVLLLKTRTRLVGGRRPWSRPQR